MKSVSELGTEEIKIMFSMFHILIWNDLNDTKIKNNLKIEITQ